MTVHPDHAQTVELVLITCPITRVTAHLAGLELIVTSMLMNAGRFRVTMAECAQAVAVLTPAAARKVLQATTVVPRAQSVVCLG